MARLAALIEHLSMNRIAIQRRLSGHCDRSDEGDGGSNQHACLASHGHRSDEPVFGSIGRLDFHRRGFIPVGALQ
jgi:hypothetical protein